MKFKGILIALSVTALVTGGWVIKGNKTQVSKGKREYLLQRVTKSTFEEIVDADGVVEARDTKLVYADRALKVKDLFYDEGDYVKRGEVIMTFDPEDKNKVARDLQKEEIQLKKLRRDLKHSKELLKVGGSSEVEIEDIEFDIQKTLLNIADLKEELSKMLDEIRSPFNGTIISIIAEENYRVNTEVELFEIADLSDVIVVAEVPEYSIKDVRVGQDVRVKPEAYNRPFQGRVEKISTLSTTTATTSNKSSFSSESSDSTEAYVEVEIAITNIPAELRPGFNTKVEIITSSAEDTLSVPRTAVLEDEEGNYIFEAEENLEIKKKSVVLGMSNSKFIEIKGIDDGATIIVDPDFSLKDGETITAASKDAEGKMKRREKTL